MEKIIVTLGGYSVIQKGGQALGTCPPMTESKRGGQRHRSIRPRLIDTVGGDSYGN